MWTFVFSSVLSLLIIQSSADIAGKLNILEDKVDAIAKFLKIQNDPYWRNCYKGMASLESHIVVDLPGNKHAICDTKTDEGGWLVFQHRTNGLQDFAQNWNTYKAGFGDVQNGGDYWLGLELIHYLTSRDKCELRVDMKVGETKYYAQYTDFEIGNETSKYPLHIGGFSGNVYDHFGTGHNNMKFSTSDNDNDIDTRNCAAVFPGGWWYHFCYSANLNGLWNDGVSTTWGTSPLDQTKPIFQPTFTEMKIRLSNE